MLIPDRHNPILVDFLLIVLFQIATEVIVETSQPAHTRKGYVDMFLRVYYVSTATCHCVITGNLFSTRTFYANNTCALSNLTL